METYSLKLVKNTGFGLAWQRSNPTIQGATFEQCTEFYNKIQDHNRKYGWWSLSMLIWNGPSMRKNRKAYDQIVAMHAAVNGQK